jgi:hypothetical protein
MMDHLTVRPTPQTGSELMGFLSIVALHPEDPVVFYIKFEGASPTAIKGRGGPYDFYPVVVVAILILFHPLSPDLEMFIFSV